MLRHFDLEVCAWLACQVNRDRTPGGTDDTSPFLRASNWRWFSDSRVFLTNAIYLEEVVAYNKQRSSQSIAKSTITAAMYDTLAVHAE